MFPRNKLWLFNSIVGNLPKAPCVITAVRSAGRSIYGSKRVLGREDGDGRSGPGDRVVPAVMRQYLFLLPCPRPRFSGDRGLFVQALPQASRRNIQGNADSVAEQSRPATM
jgi:hypothetical protein